MLIPFVRRCAIKPSAPLPALACALLLFGLLTTGAARAQTDPPAAPPPAPAQTTPTPPPPPAPASHDDDDKKWYLTFGPEIGLYLPTENKARSAFGDAWFSFGLGLGPIEHGTEKGRFQADLGLFGTSHSGGHNVYIAPLGVSYIRSLSDNESSTPYVGISADVVLTQIRSDPDGIVSRIRGTGGGSVFVGEDLNKRSYVQARYFLMGDVRGYNFSGLNLSVGYRF